MSQYPNPFKRHNVQCPPGCGYNVEGPNCQILTIVVKPGEMVESEPGTMLYLTPGTKIGICPNSCSRCCSGESACKTRYGNEGTNDEVIGLTPNFPSMVIPVPLPSVGGRFVTKLGGYFANHGQIDVSTNCDCNIFTCCCGGMGGFLRQELSGSGTAFIGAGGTIMSKTLVAGEKIIIDNHAMVGYEATAVFGVELSGNCCGACFGGQGLFVSTITGPGLVIIQSMNKDKYRQAIAPPPKQNKKQGGVDMNSIMPQ